MHKISILGSTIGKKSISFIDSNDLQVSVYAPKTSIASLFSKPVKFTNNSLFNKSINSFNKSILVRDLKGDFFKEISKKDTSVLIVDFYDEIYNLISLDSEDICVTKSNYLSHCKLESLIDKGWNEIILGSEKYWEKWNKGCESFSKNRPEDLKIILLEIYLPRFYKNKSGKIVKYSSKRLDIINKYNSVIKKCYAKFVESVKCQVISNFGNTIICQTPENEGTNYTDINEDFFREVAKRILIKLDVKSKIKDTLQSKIEVCLTNYSNLLSLENIPTIMELHSYGNKKLKTGKTNEAMACERLIQVLHNSSVPLSVKIGDSKFGYGGIGVIIHKDCEIGDYVNIGGNVTLGGGRKIVDDTGNARTVPFIEDRVYIATGAKILGGITIGNHSIIGANSVVTKDVPPFSIVAGVPGKIINTINEKNIGEYCSYLYKSLSLEDCKKRMFGKNS